MPEEKQRDAAAGGIAPIFAAVLSPDKRRSPLEHKASITLSRCRRCAPVCVFTNPSLPSTPQ